MTATAPLSIFVITAPGLEAITSAELRSLGVQPGEVETGGIPCVGTFEALCGMHLHLRTASRVVKRVAEFRARTFVELERHVKVVTWSSIIRANVPIRVAATCRKSRLYHSDAVAERVQNWVESSLAASARLATMAPRRERRLLERTALKAERKAGVVTSEPSGSPPPPPPPQLIGVRLLHDEVTVSIDASGDLLHQRGYRQAVAKAPIRETLAAAMLLASEWAPDAPLLDPLCGSGTIPIEAAMIARRIPAGLARAESGAFAFLHWPDSDLVRWGELVAEARAGVLPSVPASIVGADRDAGAIEAATANAGRAGVADDISFIRRSLSGAERLGDRGWIVTNPPYGVRVGDRDRLRDLYAALGRMAGERFEGWTFAALTADRRLEQQLASAVGVDLEERFHTTNGGIPVRLLRGRTR